jgi:hypothetical protein
METKCEMWPSFCESFVRHVSKKKQVNTVVAVPKARFDQLQASRDIYDSQPEGNRNKNEDSARRQPVNP